VLWDSANRRVEAVLGPAAAATLRRLADEVASYKFLTDYKSRGRLLPMRMITKLPSSFQLHQPNPRIQQFYVTCQCTH
jgi:hypothetical protein